VSWKIHDEWIDLGRQRHTVLFRNSDLGPDHPGHHLIHHMQIPACPTCGAPRPKDPVEFEKVKAEVLAGLNDHHRKVLRYAEARPGVRKGTGPKQ